MRISDWSSDVCSSDLFDYRFDGSLLEQPFSDDVVLDFMRHRDDRGFDVDATLFPQSRKLKIGPISAAEVNPILLIFFQRDVTQMSNGTENGREHVCTPVTNAQIVYRILLENKKQIIRSLIQ